MNDFISLAFAWSMGNSWMSIGFGAVGILGAYLILTKIFTHAVYWNIWNKNLFSSIRLWSGSLGFRSQKRNGNRKCMIRQIPLFLQTLANAVKAGYSLEQAFIFIAQEIDPPLQYPVQKLNEKLELHVPTEIALQDFAHTLHHPDIDFFVESTIIQLRTGGNLVELFHKVADLIEAKRKLAQDIKSFTSQGKMSGILIAILYPVSLALFALLSPSHVETLFFTPAGQCLLVFSLILELLGFVCIWKIIRIKI